MSVVLMRIQLGLAMVKCITFSALKTYSKEEIVIMIIIILITITMLA